MGLADDDDDHSGEISMLENIFSSGIFFFANSISGRWIPSSFICTVHFRPFKRHWFMTLIVFIYVLELHVTCLCSRARYVLHRGRFCFEVIFFFSGWNRQIIQLGSVAGFVTQALGRSLFEEHPRSENTSGATSVACSVLTRPILLFTDQDGHSRVNQ